MSFPVNKTSARLYHVAFSCSSQQEFPDAFHHTADVGVATHRSSLLSKFVQMKVLDPGEKVLLCDLTECPWHIA